MTITFVLITGLVAQPSHALELCKKLVNIDPHYLIPMDLNNMWMDLEEASKYLNHKQFLETRIEEFDKIYQRSFVGSNSDPVSSQLLWEFQKSVRHTMETSDYIEWWLETDEKIIALGHFKNLMNHAKEEHRQHFGQNKQPPQLVNWLSENSAHFSVIHWLHHFTNEMQTSVQELDFSLQRFEESMAEMPVVLNSFWNNRTYLQIDALNKATQWDLCSKKIRDFRTQLQSAVKKMESFSNKNWIKLEGNENPRKAELSSDLQESIQSYFIEVGGVSVYSREFLSETLPNPSSEEWRHFRAEVNQFVKTNTRVFQAAEKKVQLTLQEVNTRLQKSSSP